jgi:hypothetical protein
MRGRSGVVWSWISADDCLCADRAKSPAKVVVRVAEKGPALLSHTSIIVEDALSVLLLDLRTQHYAHHKDFSTGQLKPIAMRKSVSISSRAFIYILRYAGICRGSSRTGRSLKTGRPAPLQTLRALRPSAAFPSFRHHGRHHRCPGYRSRNNFPQ